MVHFPGDASKQVHMEGYQVSGQCMALVRDGCLVPTKDAPELGYIADTSDKKFVPDVFYKVSLLQYLFSYSSNIIILMINTKVGTIQQIRWPCCKGHI